MTDMTTICSVRDNIVLPALRLLGPKYGSLLAIREMLAIGLQESELVHRYQIKGPAHGLWQFEKGGGVAGVLRHPMSAIESVRICKLRGVEPTKDAVYEALPSDDLLAACFARLLLWTDPKPLPTVAQDGWNYYDRNWRPGKPRPDDWPANWKAASTAAGVQ